MYYIIVFLSALMQRGPNKHIHYLNMHSRHTTITVWLLFRLKQKQSEDL